MTMGVPGRIAVATASPTASARPGGFRPKAGGLELLAAAASDLVGALQQEGDPKPANSAPAQTAKRSSLAHS